MPVASSMVHDETSEIRFNISFYSTRWNIRNMCQYLVVQYIVKHQKYVSVSSCTVHDEASEICQYLDVHYTMKHQKYVPASSCTVHDEASDICARI